MKTKAVGFCKPMWEVLDEELSENSVAEQLLQSATPTLQKHRAKREDKWRHLRSERHGQEHTRPPNAQPQTGRHPGAPHQEHVTNCHYYSN